MDYFQSEIVLERALALLLLVAAIAFLFWQEGFLRQQERAVLQEVTTEPIFYMHRAAKKYQMAKIACGSCASRGENFPYPIEKE